MNRIFQMTSTPPPFPYCPNFFGVWFVSANLFNDVLHAAGPGLVHVSLCLSFPCPVLSVPCVCLLTGAVWAVFLYVPLLFQEAVAGASILGAMTAGSVNLPQMPQAVMAAQAPGVITGRPGSHDSAGLTHDGSVIVLLALSPSTSHI